MMKRLLGSLLGAQGGRMLGSLLGGRTGGMVGGMAGSLLGGRGGAGSMGGMLSGLMGGKKNNSVSKSTDLNESEAEQLIEIMANAAKADGHVDDSEVNAILGELGDLDAEQKDHLRKVLASPFVPASDIAGAVSDKLGAEAYVLSVLAISIDDGKEVRYLKDFAIGLGLNEDERNAIHDQLEIARL